MVGSVTVMDGFVDSETGGRKLEGCCLDEARSVMRDEQMDYSWGGMSKELCRFMKLRSLLRRVGLNRSI